MPNLVQEDQSMQLKNIFENICHGDIDQFIKIMSETVHELIEQEKEMMELLPPVHKLQTLVEWIDSKYPNDPNPEVQNDIRTWINNIKTIRQRHGLV